MARKKSDPDPRQIDSGIRADLGTLANELRKRTEERDRVASERGRWSQKLKEADEAVVHATAAIIAATRPGQIPLISPARTEAENEDGPESEGAEPASGGVVLSGTTGAPQDDETYAMVQSDTNPAECICGWEMASPAPGHDRRHAQFLRATGDADEADVPPARLTKLAGTKKRASTPARAKKKGARR